MTEQRQPRLNRTMLGKLLVIAVVMFGFGYALMPVYRQICEALGINVLTQKDGTVEYDKNTQVDKTPHHHRRVRRQCAGSVALPPDARAA